MSSIVGIVIIGAVLWWTLNWRTSWPFGGRDHVRQAGDTGAQQNRRDTTYPDQAA